MTQCKQTSQEFIKNAFTPQIAVLCTPLAEQQCQKNNLTFIELLQPFSKLGNDVHYKDPNGTVITLRNFKLTFLDVNARPPQTTLARKFLNSSVSEQSESRIEVFPINDYKLNITTLTPWFEAWRDTFLKVQYPSDHEYTKHFLSCLLVVSSSEINVIESVTQLAQSLNQMQGYAPGKLPKWFSSNLLKYFVIIHDNVDGNIVVANEAYNSLKVTYGEANCFLLRMNSRPPGSSSTDHLPDPWSQFINNNIESRDYNSPESSPYLQRATLQTSDSAINTIDYHPLSPNSEELNLDNSINEKPLTSSTRLKTHGACLSTEDVEQVKLFLFEYTKCCLLPYVEKQIYQLNDVVSNKKGVSRSFISATKRWFNPNKPGASSVAVNNLIYAPDSPELQVRRLGDLYFMFGHYSLAFQAYHLAKRDYNTDQAWLYYAGALEMAGLAAFMANESNRKTCDYLEESITTYLNTCKMPQFATRATLLSSECLKSKGLYGEAAHQLIRMTSEESDLRSALFLEQAAYCFLHSKMVRKYAFHMVLAGHRFSKAAQRKHSLRSYKQAHQIYENSGWDLAEDHIHYTIGRQAHNLHAFEEAVNSFAKLLSGDSKQSGQQQSIFLKEYLTILGNKLVKDNDSEIPTLVLPKLDHKSMKIMMGPSPPLTTPGKVPAAGVSFSETDDGELQAKWYKLEEILVTEVQGGMPVIFKPMVIMYTSSNLSKNQPIAVGNEPIQVCLTLVNPLQIVLQLKDIHLLWQFENGNSEEIITNEKSNNNTDNYVKTHITKSVLIQTSCNQNIVLSLTPRVTGIIKLLGVYYTLLSSTTPTDSIFIKGKQLFTILPSPAKDLAIKVVPLAPCLQVTFSEMNLNFFCDQLQQVTIDFHNSGTLPVHKIYMATSVPNLLTTIDGKREREGKMKNFKLATSTPAMREKYIREKHIISVSIPNNSLEPGQTISMSIYVKAPSQPGPCLVDLLIYYENIEAQLVPRYRLVRHKWSLNVQESINIDTLIQGSYNSRQTEEIAFVLKTTNLNKLHNSIPISVNVLNVGLYSRYWKFIENIVTPKNVRLNSQESAHILLKAQRVNMGSCKYSNVSLVNDGKRRNNLNLAYLAFAKKTDECQLSLFDDMSDVHNFKELNDGFVLIQWEACIKEEKERIIHGQTQLPINVYKIKEKSPEIDEFALTTDPATLLENSLRRDRNEEINPSSSEPKISCNIIFPPIIRHDFTKEKLCIVPVKLFVHSIVEDDLNIVINTLGNNCQQPAAIHSELFYPYASKNFTWVGTGSAVKEVKSLDTISVELSAVVTKAGTFDLGTRIEIYCSTKDQSDKTVLQTCQSQSALIVVDGNS